MFNNDITKGNDNIINTADIEINYFREMYFINIKTIKMITMELLYEIKLAFDTENTEVLLIMKK